MGFGRLGGHCSGYNHDDDDNVDGDVNGDSNDNTDYPHQCPDQIVEKNPSKFRIDATELAIRRNFIQTTREEVIMGIDDDVELMMLMTMTDNFLWLFTMDLQVKQMKEKISNPTQGERLAVRKKTFLASTGIHACHRSSLHYDEDVVQTEIFLFSLRTQTLNIFLYSNLSTGSAGFPWSRRRQQQIQQTTQHCGLST